MRIVALLLVLLAAPALAAEVSEEGGYIRGSIAYSFEYHPEDPGPTVVSGVLQNDQIRIVYGRTPGGLPLDLELLFKSRFGDEWLLDLRGPDGRRETARIAKEGTLELDLEDDGETELLMAYTALGRKEGTFTFSRPEEPPVIVAPDPETVQEPDGPADGGVAEPVNESAAPGESVEPADEEPAPEEAAAENGTATPAPVREAPPEEPRSALPAILLLLAVIVLGLLGYWLAGRKGLPRQRAARPKKSELIGERLKEAPERASKEAAVITRTPRQRRK